MPNEPGNWGARPRSTRGALNDSRGGRAPQPVMKIRRLTFILLLMLIVSFGRLIENEDEDDVEDDSIGAMWGLMEPDGQKVLATD
jgi:hypothetical protein